MGLNTLFKGRKVRITLGYGKSVILTINSINENVHRYINGEAPFLNYTVHFTNKEERIFNSLDDINFVKPTFFECLKNKLL